jgi:hypothetical protein
MQPDNPPGSPENAERWCRLRDITDLEEYDVVDEPTVARREWVCDFCDRVIKPAEEYYWVRRKGRWNATLRCCQTCHDKHVEAQYERLRGGRI